MREGETMWWRWWRWWRWWQEWDCGNIASWRRLFSSINSKAKNWQNIYNKQTNKQSVCSMRVLFTSCCCCCCWDIPIRERGERRVASADLNWNAMPMRCSADRRRSSSSSRGEEECVDCNQGRATNKLRTRTAAGGGAQLGMPGIAVLCRAVSRSAVAIGIPTHSPLGDTQLFSCAFLRRNAATAGSAPSCCYTMLLCISTRTHARKQQLKETRDKKKKKKKKEQLNEGLLMLQAATLCKRTVLLWVGLGWSLIDCLRSQSPLLS